ncbi:unnamed protein product [Lepidochelys kempii]
MGPDWQEKDTLDYINTFLKGNEQEEAKKLEFLDRVITISRAALTRHPEQNLAAFLCKALLVEKIKELIDLEFVDSLTSGVRQQAMLAIMELSKVKPLLRGTELSSLLTVCFSSVFSLPPAETNQGMEAALYNNTLNTMDELLKTLVCEDEKRNLVVLQNIVECPAPLDRIQGGACAAEGSGKNHLADQIHLRSTQIQGCPRDALASAPARLPDEDPLLWVLRAIELLQLLHPPCLGPKLDTVLQMRPHQCRLGVEGDLTLLDLREWRSSEEFRVLGQLVGCLTLHCAEQEQEIC